MVTIKAEYHNTVVAFGTSGVALSKRSQSDLVDLAIMAHESKDPGLLKFFDNIPSIDDLRRMKLEVNIQKYKKQTSTKPKKVETRKK